MNHDIVIAVSRFEKSEKTVDDYAMLIAIISNARTHDGVTNNELRASIQTGISEGRKKP